MNKGRIIVLNGVSSSGKTTLVRELQKKLSETYYWLANDTFVNMLPFKCWGDNLKEYMSQALIMLNKVIKTFSDDEKNVIIDQVMQTTDKSDIFKDLVIRLHGYPVLLVNVVCPIPELERREKERGDRNIGQAVSQLSLLNPQDGYDIVVDTFNKSISDCADEIIEMLNSSNNAALAKFYNQFIGIEYEAH